MKKVYFGQLVFYIIVYLSGSFENSVVIISIMVMHASMSIYHLINFSKIYTFGESAIAGVCITSLISLCNLGNNRWITYRLV